MQARFLQARSAAPISSMATMIPVGAPQYPMGPGIDQGLSLGRRIPIEGIVARAGAEAAAKEVAIRRPSKKRAGSHGAYEEHKEHSQRS